jgi:hypothetical protein
MGRSRRTGIAVLAALLCVGAAVGTGTFSASAAPDPNGPGHPAGGQHSIPPPLTVAHLEDQPPSAPPIISMFPSVTAQLTGGGKALQVDATDGTSRFGITITATTGSLSDGIYFESDVQRGFSPPATPATFTLTGNWPFCTDPAGSQFGWMQIDQLGTSAGDTVAAVGIRLYVIACGHVVGGTIAFNVADGTPGQGYYLQDPYGDIAGTGNDRYLEYVGSIGLPWAPFGVLNQPVVAMARAPDDSGYLLAAADGGVFAFGRSRFYGSAADLPLVRPIVGMAAVPRGDGYWLVAADGGVFAFGGAPFLGSMGGVRLDAPVVGMAATPSGRGYWLVAADGGVFAFGDARYLGSMGGHRLAGPVTSMAATDDGSGYWLAAADGGVFAFGSAGFAGSAVGQARPLVTGIVPTLDDKGYWLVDSAFHATSFGDAPTAPDEWDPWLLGLPLTSSAAKDG